MDDHLVCIYLRTGGDIFGSCCSVLGVAIVAVAQQQQRAMAGQIPAASASRSCYVCRLAGSTRKLGHAVSSRRFRVQERKGKQGVDRLARVLPGVSRVALRHFPMLDAGIAKIRPRRCTRMWGEKEDMLGRLDEAVQRCNDREVLSLPRHRVGIFGYGVMHCEHGQQFVINSSHHIPSFTLLLWTISSPTTPTRLFRIARWLRDLLTAEPSKPPHQPSPLLTFQ